MRNTTNLLILNLAVADLLFLTACVPFTACDYVLTYWPFGQVWCRSVDSFQLVLPNNFEGSIFKTFSGPFSTSFM